MDITINNFEEEVKNAKGIVVVDFWAGWCGPCRMQGAILNELAQVKPEVKIAKINVDNEPVLAQTFDVMSIPTLVFYKDGEPIKKVVGVHNIDALVEIINTL
jgi:thioredoxin 1